MAYKTYTKQVWKGSVITSPVPPTLVTSEYEGVKYVFTVAWTGILCTQPPVTYISVRPERYSYELISKSGEFVINLATQELTKAVDICGVKSGRKMDKFAHLGLTCEKASKVNAPILVQSPVNIECKVRETVKLGTHDMFIADIVALDIANELVDEKGRLALEKAGLLAYSHGEYFGLGKKLGSFGYSVRKKRNNNKKRNQNQ
ncbi:MAG: flavin reductase family protein [Ruminococcus sp.]|nr:flavin reductase family protein [Ruminococcus sp.]